MIGLNAGDELDDRACRDDCLTGRRRLTGGGRAADVIDELGSKDVGIEMKEGLPIAPLTVGPKVGVEPADFTVGGDVSELRE
jgi:hypothetical protein